MIEYGKSRVEKSHSRDLGFVPSLFQLVMFGWITWDRAGPLGGKCTTVDWESQGVVLASQHLQGCSPRLCRLRTDGLAPVSKYWMYRSHAGDMSPVNLVTCHQQMLGFVPTASRLAQERNWVWTNGLVSRCAMDYTGSPFSQEQYVGWGEKRTCRVYQVFRCRVYIDSNRRDSWIWVTACSWQSSRRNLMA
jgi:hypothetical protein